VVVGCGVEVCWLDEVLGVLASVAPEHDAINKEVATSTVGWSQRPALIWKILDAPIGGRNWKMPGRPAMAADRSGVPH
jgi:hypothetical protein